MPPVSRAMKHSRCAALLDEPTLRAGRSVGGKQSALAGKALPTRRLRRHMREVNVQLFATRRNLSLSCRLCFHTPTTTHTANKSPVMPPLRTSRNRKPPPEGFDDIEDTLLEFANKMKDAENASHEGKKKHEMLWPVFQITHQRMYALG